MRNPSFTREHVCDALAAALTEHMGLGRRYLVRDVMEATGIGESSLKMYRRGEQTPSLTDWLRLCAFLGPTFADRVTGIAGIANVDMRDEADPDHRQLLRETLRLADTIAQGTTPHGTLDNRTIAALERNATTLRARCNAWLVATQRRAARFMRRGRDEPAPVGVGAVDLEAVRRVVG